MWSCITFYLLIIIYLFDTYLNINICFHVDVGGVILAFTFCKISLCQILRIHCWLMSVMYYSICASSLEKSLRRR